MLLSLLRIRGGHRAFLAGFVLACAQVFVIIHLLSLFEAISAGNVAGAQLLILVVLWLVRRPRRTGYPLPALRPIRWLSSFWHQCPSGAGGYATLGALLAFTLVPLYIALTVPQKPRL